jgi:hypothetical protein
MQSQAERTDRGAIELLEFIWLLLFSVNSAAYGRILATLTLTNKERKYIYLTVRLIRYIPT